MTRFPKRAFAAVSLLAFGLLFEYELVRAATESMFLGRYGRQALPYVWLAVAGGAAAAVAGYNALVTKWSAAQLFGGGAVLSTALLGALLAGRDSIPHAEVLLYVWKDVHIVVLLEILWTVANHRFAVHDARLSYGLICFIGSLGSFSGAKAVAFIAAAEGTSVALWAAALLLLLLAAGSLLLGDIRNAARRKPQLGEAVRVLRTSSYVRLMLALIVVTQIVITVIDYEFNASVEASFSDEDRRTVVIGDVYAWIAGLSMALQVGAGLLMRALGIGGTLLLVPALLGATLLLSSIVPSFALVAATKVSSKSMDYSIFRAAKEILYIPLSAAEKTQGKAVIDMFGYRFAKAGASLLLLGLVALGAESIVRFVGVALIVLWIAVTLPLVREFAARTRDGRSDASAVRNG